MVTIDTASQRNSTFHGWSGCGYVITNPATGDGAYMISGGENGGLICIFLAAVFAVLAIATSGSVMGAYVFGMLALLFATQGLVLLYGDKAANDFINCMVMGQIGLLEAVVLALDKYLALSPFSFWRKLIFQYVVAVIAAIDDETDFRQCLEDLYSHQ